MYEAARRLVQTHARRLPLLDFDSDTGHEVIVSVLTTYRLLKFISINVRDLELCTTFFTLIALQCHKEVGQLYMGLRKLGIGKYVETTPSIPETMTGATPAYHPLATASMTTSVFDVVHMFSELGVSSVPILDDDGVVMNLYETVDVIVSWHGIVQVRLYSLNNRPSSDSVHISRSTSRSAKHSSSARPTSPASSSAPPPTRSARSST
jgi:5'-AMP-activated protein kinase regulatory gamma subunit